MMSLTVLWLELSTLLSVFVTVGNCNWLCDFVELDCSTEAPVMMLSAKQRPSWNSWGGGSLPMEQFVASSLLSCAAYAAMKNFFALLYFRDKRCFGIGDEGGGTESGQVIRDTFEPLLPHNIAANKTFYATPSYSVNDGKFYAEKFAVDGSIANVKEMYASNGMANPWYIVDLGSPVQIQHIRVISRQDVANGRFVKIYIRAGNTLVTSGSLSSYEDISYLPGPPPGLGVWNDIFVDSSLQPFQFVAVQMMASGFMEIAELEVYGI